VILVGFQFIIPSTEILSGNSSYIERLRIARELGIWEITQKSPVDELE
jgi:hypothetical protein